MTSEAGSTATSSIMAAHQLTAVVSPLHEAMALRRSHSVKAADLGGLEQADTMTSLLAGAHMMRCC